MKISKGNVRNINKKILAGTIAFTFFATKIVGYKAVKPIKYSYFKQEYVQFAKVDIVITKDYAIIPEKIKLDGVRGFNLSKKNKGKGSIVSGKRRILKKHFK